MGRRTARHAGALLLGALLLGGGTSNAETLPVKEDVRTSALLNADGSGRLYVNSSPGPLSPDWSWEACTSSLSSCQHFATGGDIGTGSAPPNTVFRVSRAGELGVSPIWHGSLGVVEPPSVSGAIRANELVTPIPATWSGGWDGDFDQTQLSVCWTPTGERCISLTEPKYTRGCGQDATVLDPAFTGKYLRIADQRYGPGTMFTMEAAVSPYGHEIWQAAGSTAVAMLGRIKASNGPRSTNCGPPPLIEASISATGEATVRCGLGCRATVIVRQGKARVRVMRKVTAVPRLGFGREVALRLSDRAIEALEPGRAHVVVKVNGAMAARRTVSLPSLAQSGQPRRAIDD